MPINDTGILRVMSEKMSYLGQKQAVLAQNVANASTPGYQAKELAPFSFADAMKDAGSGLHVTDANHIVPASMAGVNAGAKKMRSFETVPSGNSVDLEQQMMEVSKTTIDYQASASIYHKFVALWRMAAGK